MKMIKVYNKDGFEATCEKDQVANFLANGWTKEKPEVKKSKADKEAEKAAAEAAEKLAAEKLAAEKK